MLASFWGVQTAVLSALMNERNSISKNPPSTTALVLLPVSIREDLQNSKLHATSISRSGASAKRTVCTDWTEATERTGCTECSGCTERTDNFECIERTGCIKSSAITGLQSSDVVIDKKKGRRGRWFDYAVSWDSNHDNNVYNSSWYKWARV